MKLLITYNVGTVAAWGEGFLPRLQAGLAPLGEAELLDLTGRGAVAIGEAADLAEVEGLALYVGRLTEACLERAPRLRIVGTIGDNRAHDVAYAALQARGIPLVDTTRGWAQSVAELGLGLILAGLRSSAWWHTRVATGQDDGQWPGGQFSDNPAFVNGELSGKRVGIVGLGAIGSALARLLAAFPAQTMAYDPFAPPAAFDRAGAAATGLDELLETAEIVVVCVPPNPTSRGMIDERRVGILPRGSLLVLVTRAAPVDMAAVRRRVLADELFLAADVFDVEPLPADDPLRGRANVVHTPHIAGRTQDARDRMADLLIADFRRCFAGEPLQGALPPEVVARNSG